MRVALCVVVSLAVLAARPARADDGPDNARRAEAAAVRAEAAAARTEEAAARVEGASERLERLVNTLEQELERRAKRPAR